MEYRKAKKEDVNFCYSCIKDAKEYQKKLGFVQWHDGYPTIDNVREDIDNEKGYILFNKDEDIGYFALYDGPDSDYNYIDGDWLNNKPYMVLHRLCYKSGYSGTGLSPASFEIIRKLVIDNGYNVIRVDTHEDNKVMRHILQREGFVYCGIIYFNNSPRLAYECDI